MKSMDLLKLLVIVSFTAGCTTATQQSSESELSSSSESEISNSESSVLESSSLTEESSISDSSSPSDSEPSIIQVYVPTDFEYI